MRSLFVVLLCLGCGASLPKGTSATDVSGTYDFIACDGDPCTPGGPNVYASGSIVLANEPLEFQSASTRLMARLSLDAEHRNSQINGCFAIKTVRKIQTLLGQVKAGVLDWKRGPDGLIRFYLYYNIGEKAEYQVIARFDAGGAMEAAGSWKQISSHIVRDYLWGQRRGPPDSEACRAAIELRYTD
jgi:hypothetical protein